MKRLLVALLGIILLGSCIPKTNEKNVKTENMNLIESHNAKGNDKLSILTDTITELKKIGNEILLGKKISSFEDADIYKLIDCAICEDSTDRVFYFKVLNEIRHQSKGEMAEISSWKIKDFCYKFPNDFFNLTNPELNSYALEIYEIIRTEEESPLEYAKEYINEIRSKIKPELSDKVESFSKAMLDSFAE